MAAAVCVRVSVCVRIRGCQKKNENELRRIIKATAAPIPVSQPKNTGASRTTHTHRSQNHTEIHIQNSKGGKNTGQRNAQQKKLPKKNKRWQKWWLPKKKHAHSHVHIG